MALDAINPLLTEPREARGAVTVDVRDRGRAERSGGGGARGRLRSRRQAPGQVHARAELRLRRGHAVRGRHQAGDPRRAARAAVGRRPDRRLGRHHARQAIDRRPHRHGGRAARAPARRLRRRADPVGRLPRGRRDQLLGAPRSPRAAGHLRLRGRRSARGGRADLGAVDRAHARHARRLRDGRGDADEGARRPARADGPGPAVGRLAAGRHRVRAEGAARPAVRPVPRRPDRLRPAGGRGAAGQGPDRGPDRGPLQPPRLRGHGRRDRLLGPRDPIRRPARRQPALAGHAVHLPDRGRRHAGQLALHRALRDRFCAPRLDVDGDRGGSGPGRGHDPTCSWISTASPAI